MSFRGREPLGTYAFLSPWALGFLAFLAGPMVVALVAASLSDSSILRAGQAHSAAPHNAALGHALVVALLYMGLVVPADLVVGMLLALVLNARAWGVGGVRTVRLFPVLVAGVGGASVGVAMLWLWVINTRLGLLNLMLSAAHLPAQTWVFSDRALLPSLALMCLWTVGRSMLVYLAGLQGLPGEVLWSAHIDGASAWLRWRRVTLPLIAPMLFFNLVLDVVQALQTFSQAYVVNQVAPGSPALSYLVYVYANAFTLHGMGYASLLAWILFAAMLALTALILRSARRWAHYRGAAS